MSFDINERRDLIGTIELYTHGFKVIARDDRVSTATRIVLREWAAYSEEMVEKPDGTRVKQRVISQTYGTAFPGNREFWLHKGQFKDWQTELLRYELTPDDFHIDRIPLYKPQAFEVEMADGRVPFDYQVEAANFALEEVPGDDHFSKLIGIPPGKGKATSNRTLVRVPEGWKPMGEIKTGDLVMIPSGEFTKVTGVFPQGKIPLYNVEFEDQRSTEVCMDHLWEVERQSGATEVVDTACVLEFLLSDTEVSIPMVRPKTSPIWEEVKAIILEKGKPALTDGHVIDPEALSDYPDIVDIVREHGGKITEFIKGYLIVHPDLSDIPFNNRLAIKDITRIEDDEATCISIEHPDKLFIIENYIVTHNTITLCYTSTLLKQRTVIGILKKYAKKWPGDVLENLKKTPKDIMVIEKTTQLRGVIDLCKTEGCKKLPPYIIITLSTLRGYIDSYDIDPDGCVEDYGCAPYELWGLLGCGMFAIDEAHEHLNTVFKVAMYLHGPKFVALSGTFLGADAQEVKYQQAIFPNYRRFEGIESGQYTDLEFISYIFGQQTRAKIRFNAFGRTDYSHAVFEQSIIRFPDVLRDYLTMQCALIDYGYIQEYQKNDKCIVFVGTVEMADKFVAALTVRYRHLNVQRYCKSDGDDYDEMMKGDIIVTTIQSGGTGIDIRGLTYLLNTAMVNSAKSNIQLFYRAREIKNRIIRASMPYNAQNPKHRKYTEYRRELFASRTKSMRTFNYNRPIGP